MEHSQMISQLQSSGLIQYKCGPLTFGPFAPGESIPEVWSVLSNTTRVVCGAMDEVQPRDIESGTVGLHSIPM